MKADHFTAMTTAYGHSRCSQLLNEWTSRYHTHHKYSSTLTYAASIVFLKTGPRKSIVNLTKLLEGSEAVQVLTAFWISLIGLTHIVVSVLIKRFRLTLTNQIETN